MPRIFITGVTGFVGTNLVKHFSSLPDFSVIGHSREVVKAKQQYQPYNIEIVSDYAASTLNTQKIDYVIHLVGIAHDLSNQFTPEDYYRVNFEGTKDVYDEFLLSSAAKFIFVSSIKAAVDIAKEPVREEVTPNPVTDYGKSKLKAEQYIQSRTSVAGKRFYILRPCMIHGPGNKGNLNLLYRFVRTGIPFPFGAFENQRSFLSIDNFISIVRHLLQKDVAPWVYHLADDGFLSTKELYELIATALGKRPRVLNIPKNWIQHVANTLGKKHLINKLTEDMLVSNKRILSVLGVQLPVSLKEGIIKTIKSFRG
jgi:nucleoside-diphosphate-sugar epimerase